MQQGTGILATRVRDRDGITCFDHLMVSDTFFYPDRKILQKMNPAEMLSGIALEDDRRAAAF